VVRFIFVLQLKESKTPGTYHVKVGETPKRRADCLAVRSNGKKRKDSNGDLVIQVED